jgi:hypothetical protein
MIHLKKNLSVFFSSALLFLFHLPFVFAKSAEHLFFNQHKSSHQHNKTIRF